MNNNYIKPEITIIKFNEKDIISGSAESYDRIDEDGNINLPPVEIEWRFLFTNFDICVIIFVDIIWIGGTRIVNRKYP